MRVKGLGETGNMAQNDSYFGRDSKEMPSK